MTNPPPPNPILFEQNGPFYDMVGAFMVATVGLESVARKDNPMGFRRDGVIVLEGKVHDELRIDQYAIYQNVQSGRPSFVHVNNSLVGMLVNTAYEAVKDRNDRTPAFEFFRHIRNASSHKNTFNFHESEPARPASWRTKVIEHQLKGRSNPLFGQRCFGPFLASADALLLLWDIEQILK